MPQSNPTAMPRIYKQISASDAATTAASQNGVKIIASGSPLTRLNYFDGKLLRAADLSAEQTYLRTLVELSNQSGGPGVAYGYSVSLTSANQFLLSSGLAIDPKGRLLLMTDSQTISIPDLLATKVSALASSPRSAAGPSFADCAEPTTDDGTLLKPSDLYLLVIAYAETLCGEEDVYGKLCQEACVTSTDRPYAVEGIVVQLIPWALKTALPTSKAATLGIQHLRSRVASAYFQDERNPIGDLISKAGLHSEIWCMGADGLTGNYVPLGIVGWTGSAVAFFDAWTVRRERMNPRPALLAVADADAALGRFSGAGAPVPMPVARWPANVAFRRHDRSLQRSQRRSRGSGLGH